MPSCVETLKQAKALLEKGWCQGKSKPGGPYNILGAIYAIQFDIDAIYVVSQMVRKIGFHSTEEYNDREGRTKEQVLEFMDASIRLAVEREFFNPSLGEPYTEPVEEETRTKWLPTT